MHKMDITIGLAYIAIIGTLAGIIGYFLMRAKFLRELEIGKGREVMLARHAYETAVLKEIGDRIGYSLNAVKIVEIISRSLGQLLSYSTVSYMIFIESDEKIRFDCNVKETVSGNFIKDVKSKMLAALSEMLAEPLVDIDVDESIAGTILDETENSRVLSFFNLPIIIMDKVVGLITVASKKPNLYGRDETDVLYRIARQASEAVSKLQGVLENEKSKLAQAVESLSDGLLMVDTKYRLILANRKLRELLGTVANPKIFDIVNALAGNFDVRTKMEEAVSKDEPLPPQEIVIKDKVLEVFVSKVQGRPSYKPMGVVVLFHDITDVKSLEKLRQDFTAMMVHELRAPLTGIKSTVEMIKTNPSRISAVDLSKYLSTIDTTSQTMLELVNDLLDVAKLEAGKFDVVSEEGDLAAIIIERAEGFRAKAYEKNLAINVDIEKNLPKGLFDKVRIKQVFNNLISNAIKYTDSGEITIRAACELVDSNPIDILVSVSDTGIGIEPDAVDGLFSKFGQLAAGKKKGAGSSGLGLYITKEIVEAWGGRIWVESQGLGTGSTFRFTVGLAKGKGVDQVESEGRRSYMGTKVGQA